MTNYKIDLVISKDENGYVAYCPALEGCITQGDSYEEVLEHAQKAVELYLSTMTPSEISEVVSREILTTSLPVQVA